MKLLTWWSAWSQLKRPGHLLECLLTRAPDEWQKTVVNGFESSILKLTGMNLVIDCVEWQS